MIEKKDTRRYYLHKQVKKFAKVYATEHTISMTEDNFKKCTKKQKEYLNEMKSMFGYSIQFELPMYINY